MLEWSGDYTDPLGIDTCSVVLFLSSSESTFGHPFSDWHGCPLGSFPIFVNILDMMAYTYLLRHNHSKILDAAGDNL